MKYLNTYKLFLEHNNHIDNKINELLDKISKEGIRSLSKEEKSFLDAYNGGDVSIELAYNELTKEKKKGEIEDDKQSPNLNISLYDWIEYSSRSGLDKNLIEFIKINPDYLKEYSPRVLSVVSNSIKNAKNIKGIELVISVLTSKEFSHKYMDMFY